MVSMGGDFAVIGIHPIDPSRQNGWVIFFLNKLLHVPPLDLRLLLPLCFGSLVVAAVIVGTVAVVVAVFVLVLVVVVVVFLRRHRCFGCRRRRRRRPRFLSSLHLGLCVPRPSRCRATAGRAFRGFAWVSLGFWSWACSTAREI